MRIIDLSLPIDSDMPGVRLSPAKRIATDGWNATTMELYSHCGTHMDAPCHFLPEGRHIDAQDLSVALGPARVVNLTPTQPKQLLQVEDFAAVDDEVTPGCRLLLRTDWSKRYGSPEYRNDLPRISKSLADWLVQRQVALLGVEPPSVADVNNMDEVTEIHQILFRGNVLIVEGLTNLDQISQDIVDFIALPLKVVGGDGTPVRAVAIEQH
ncbi:cyclase family protein [Novipirellula artificiosorum]|uniref:Kynurenine formamidase n=1 Tax=Novipirellula artificiosorum TaxID=2528016 RepID=A0A5C6DTQ7_9BACT|nr:cyclase family protein [Novipirellula artificiosorum]TWU40723.1 Kynurenine formamidase [Novipirellula artificiosorum]